MNRFNENQLSASYSCQDTNCNARGTIKFNINENNNEIIDLNNLVFIQKNEHSLERNDHNYIRNLEIIKDFEIFNISIIKKIRRYKLSKKIFSRIYQ